MTNLIRAAALLGLVLTATAAQARPATLGDCYNVVIAACNKTAHPVECSESAMDACDEEYDQIALPPTRRGLGIKSN